MLGGVVWNPRCICELFCVDVCLGYNLVWLAYADVLDGRIETQWVTGRVVIARLAFVNAAQYRLVIRPEAGFAWIVGE